MTGNEESHGRPLKPRCCPCGGLISRRDLLKAGGTALGGLALGGCAWSALRAVAAEAAPPPARQSLVVKPIFSHDLPQRRPQTSWRNWGGIETQAQANEEVGRIQKELDALRAAADFPVTFLPVAAIRGAADVAKIADLDSADAILFYPAGGWFDIFDAVLQSGKPAVFFLRHKSGPLYYWYEGISARYLHRHTDHLAVKGVDNQDVVVDSPAELLWRLRALCGLKNTLGSRIVTIGGAGGWECPQAPDIARTKWKLDIQDVPYPELGKLIQAAREDNAAVARARQRADAYLKDGALTLETKKTFVENAFLLEQVFRSIMAVQRQRLWHKGEPWVK